MSDVRVLKDGAMVGLEMLTDEAEAWVADNVATQPWQWLGKVLWIDERLSVAVVEGMQAEGLAMTT